MAARDIMPWISPLGGTYEVRWLPLQATAEVFFVGEPVNSDPAGSGGILEPPDDGTVWTLADMDTVGNVAGIAAAGPGAAEINPQTGNTYVVGDAIPYWPTDQNILFITNNFWATGAAGTAVVPLQTDVGEIYALSEGGAGWGVEQTAGVPGTDVFAIVHEVLDAFNEPIRISGRAGARLVFEIKTAQ